MTMSLTQEHIYAELDKRDKWGTKSEYKVIRPKTSFAMMNREIDRGKIGVKLDPVDGKIKMNFSHADYIFGYADSGLFD
jgi:hypothetical protein